MVSFGGGALSGGGGERGASINDTHTRRGEQHPNSLSDESANYIIREVIHFGQMHTFPALPFFDVDCKAT